MVILAESDDSKRLSPSVDIPSIKTDLKLLSKDENVLVRLGHSAYFMILDGKTYLVDPTLVTGSPVWFVNKTFMGTSVYQPEDIPEIDYLIITHDHYDHLDYFTVKEIKDRVGKVLTSLGDGAHFERRGFNPENIIEMDWYDESVLDNDIKITCLPARHYSGRLWQNKTLWSSFMLETPSKTIYIGGDSGYDKFFKEYGEKWNIDLALIENGQYDQQWKYIHMLPEDVVQAIKDLNPKKVMTVHNSKYAMANHARDEPMIQLDKLLQEEGLTDNFGRGIWLTPMIGEVVKLDKNRTFSHRWVDLEYEDRLEYKGNKYLQHSSINKNRIGNQLDCLLPKSRRSECDELEFYQRKDHSDDKWLIQCRNDDCVTYLKRGIEEYPTEEELGMEINCIPWDGSLSDLSCGELIFEPNRYFSAFGNNPERTLTAQPGETGLFNNDRYDVKFYVSEDLNEGVLMHLFRFGENYKLLYDKLDIKFIKGECDDGIQGEHKKAESNYKVIIYYRGEKVYEGCGNTREKEDINSEKEPEVVLSENDPCIQYLESLVMWDSEIGDEQDINEEVLSNIQETMNKISIINLTIGNKTFQLKLDENSATEEFVQKLKEGDIIVHVHDYGGFEKVGDLGFSLPREDKQITTQLGDLVLYQGNQISLFYNSNSWSYTKLGKVQNLTKSDLGDGDVDLIFSLIY